MKELCLLDSNTAKVVSYICDDLKEILTYTGALASSPDSIRSEACEQER